MSNANSFSVTGTLHFADETVQVTDTFKKREFVLEIPGQYPEYPKFELKQDSCSLLDDCSVGDTITVHYNLSGRKYEKNDKTSYFNSLRAWKIEEGTGAVTSAKKTAPAATAQPTAKAIIQANQASKQADDSFDSEDDGLPF